MLAVMDVRRAAFEVAPSAALGCFFAKEASRWESQNWKRQSREAWDDYALSVEVSSTGFWHSVDSLISSPPMAQFLVRHLDDEVKARLQRRARRHGRSMQEEVREILRNAVRDEDGA